jgi:hypothetical protein
MLRSLKQKFFGLLATHWGFSRIIRAVAGVAALIFAIRNDELLLGAAGGLLLLMAFFNIGCAGNSCSVPTNKAGTK